MQKISRTLLNIVKNSQVCGLRGFRETGPKALNGAQPVPQDQGSPPETQAEPKVEDPRIFITGGFSVQYCQACFDKIT